MSTRIAVVGGTGLIGSRVVATLTDHGHDAVAASPDTGVDTITGEGLADLLDGASAVVDVSNSPSLGDTAVMEFFTTSTRNLLAAEAEADVQHHVALSIVGTDRLTQSGYFRAKRAQETLIEDAGVPYTIVRSTQFYEFAEQLAASATEGDTIRIAPALVQPIAAADAAAAAARIAVGRPAGGVVEVAGPEQFRLDVFLERWLRSRDDPRIVTTDQTVPYFGAVLDERDLLPDLGATIGAVRYADWLRLGAAWDRAQRAAASG